jgi:hypothetical protein
MTRYKLEYIWLDGTTPGWNQEFQRLIWQQAESSKICVLDIYVM